MEKEKLKTILLNYGYSKDGLKSIMAGRMKPSYKKMLLLNKEHNIPFEAWQDIKSYISEQNQKQKKDLKND